MPFRIKAGPGAFEAFRGGALPSTATKFLFLKIFESALIPKVVRAGKIPSLEVVRIDPGHLSAISTWIYKKSLEALVDGIYMPLWRNWHTHLAKNQGFAGSNRISSTAWEAQWITLKPCIEWRCSLVKNWRLILIPLAWMQPNCWFSSNGRAPRWSRGRWWFESISQHHPW